MNTENTNKPRVLCFSGLDPSGGAGIQADIEALFSAGCHCLPVVTSLTVQDSRNVLSAEAVAPALLVQQARAVLEDVSVQAIKIGLLGSIQSMEVIHTILKDYPRIPVVLDPILWAGGGYEFSSDDVASAMKSLLLPLTHVLTPNTRELEALSPFADTQDAGAAALLELGCKHVLLTGTHADTSNVVNSLYTDHTPVQRFEWPRLPHEYHGSGCTLAASLAAYLAHGFAIGEAARRAQQYTWESLQAGSRPGFGQWLPNRAYWNT
ncbi:MAG: hydroxymethylpyrimidine/phosphomethylpyrimidine kinase [Pseudomonadales bacterium]|nr:hydroxymethylpyrimidine/phosphomethylpyrimidine kinase [Pseudomonadales bacterium]